METENRKNEVFLYIGAFFLTAGGLSIVALMLLYIYF